MFTDDTNPVQNEESSNLPEVAPTRHAPYTHVVHNGREEEYTHDTSDFSEQCPRRFEAELDERMAEGLVPPSGPKVGERRRKPRRMAERGPVRWILTRQCEGDDGGEVVHHVERTVYA